MFLVLAAGRIGYHHFYVALAWPVLVIHGQSGRIPYTQCRADSLFSPNGLLGRRLRTRFATSVSPQP